MLHTVSSSREASSALLSVCLPTDLQNIHISMPKDTRERGPNALQWAFTSHQEFIYFAERKNEAVYFVCQQEFGEDSVVKTDGINEWSHHWQGYVEFKERKRTTAVQRFIQDNNAHCSPRKKSRHQAANYCKKLETCAEDVCRIEWGVRPPTEGGTGRAVTAAERNEVFRRAYHAETREEAIDLILCENARDHWNCYGNHMRLLNDRWPVQPHCEIFQPTCAWVLPTEITNWLQVEFTKTERARCLVVVGPTRCGKTSWAQSLGRHIFWRTQVGFNSWDPTAKYIVIDDIQWRYIPYKKAILTHMGKHTVTDKYMKKLSINVTMPAIVLVNEPFEFEEEREYWERNTTVVQIHGPMYDKTQRTVA